MVEVGVDVLEVELVTVVVVAGCVDVVVTVLVVVDVSVVVVVLVVWVVVVAARAAAHENELSAPIVIASTSARPAAEDLLEAASSPPGTLCHIIRPQSSPSATQIELRLTIPYTTSPIPRHPASGATSSGHRANSQPTVGRSTASARAPMTRHTTAMPSSGSV